MKLVILAGTTKRELVGPLDICGSGEDLLLLANTIKEKVNSDKFFGWVRVPEKTPIYMDPSLGVNEPPTPWDCK